MPPDIGRRVVSQRVALRAGASGRSARRTFVRSAYYQPRPLHAFFAVTIIID